MKYRIGQKVVFIGPDMSAQTSQWGWTAPTPNAIYTIRGSRMYDGFRPGYVFEELINPALLTARDGVTELHINEEFLRPLVSRKTSIEIFHRILRSASHKELT